ncbi:UPF0223 family protein [Levilactobacillus hammesii]|uniref:Uncharacterized protein n=1 Tax=Levilactobacillus hammesii DSM 16381 TaxID=1423753 RepID=A0A0R1UN50_9LACO|nr:UPF0223 family protein [Levilactobacillus hammesii]KRL94720.1 hypothetical protein FD28_GL000297 [Levilactobacillus hammesii DSM 16381]
MTQSSSNYEYPLQADWSTADIVAVTTLYQRVEDAYELNQGVPAEVLLAAYREFQKVVPQKFEEKQLGREFEQASGYSIYRTVKQAREQKGRIRMKGVH